LLLLEPAGQGARAVRPLAQNRSEARQDAAEPGHRARLRKAGSRRRTAGVAEGDGRRTRESRSTGRKAGARQPAVGASGHGGRRHAQAGILMLLRLALFVILAFFVARAFWRLLDGIVEGASRGSRGSQVPQRGVQMFRDPVCGTFVVADRAVTLT